MSKPKKNSHIWRKAFNGSRASLHEWSRMLHLSWKRELLKKLDWKKNKEG